MKNQWDKLQMETVVIHAGGTPDPLTGAVMPPIYQTSTYAQKSPGEHYGYEYTRSHNPTRDRLEEALAALEKAKYSLVTASGMSAVTLIMHSLKRGAKILCGDDVYGGTYRLLTTVFANHHQFQFVDFSNLALASDEINKFKPDMIWLETPTNPMLKITDIKAISKLAKINKSLVVVDNTFMSPILQNPISLGADLVLHSLTKYINGHSDVVAGAIMLNDKKIYQQLWTLQNSIGPSQSPFDSWLVLRGIKTLALRMQAHDKNGRKVADFLQQHPRVINVIYPGLKSHPHHKLAKNQMSGFGGMISFHLEGGLKESKKFLSRLRIFTLAESLGGVESLVNHPAIMTHASVPIEKRKLLGIDDNLIRLSVGIENATDLVEDLRQALN